MTYRVRISEQADADLRGIYEYIAFNLRSAQNAARQLKRLEKAIYELDTMPNRYPAYKKGKWERRGSVRQYDIEKLKMATVLQNWNRQSRQRLVRNAPAAVCYDLLKTFEACDAMNPYFRGAPYTTLTPLTLAL